MTETDHPWGPFDTPYEAIGGQDKIRSIVDRFYDIIDSDAPNVRSLLPRDDSTSRDKLYAYLVEWAGGPALYTPERGLPRMRLRHNPFPIGGAEVESWLTCFGQALDENGISGDIRNFLDERFTALAQHMQNQA